MTDVDPTEQISARVRDVVARVEEAARAAGRDPAEVAVMLAVKTRSDAEIRAAALAMAELTPDSPVLLGHNRVQEMVAGGPALDREANPSLPALSMHLIGPLQSNKINQTLRWADGVDTVGDLRLAEKLDAAVARHREDGRWDAERVFDVLVQVNTSGEETKSGAAPAEARELAAQVGTLENLRLRGFLTIGAHTTDEGAVRASFDVLREIRDDVLASGRPGTADARELSMGMTADLELAIACGATIVRIGTAAFGPRATA